MNLWVKRTGQLLVAVLLLMSCEDDSFLLGFKNPNKQFNAGYYEFKFIDKTAMMLVDSIVTDNPNGNTYEFLVGQYVDPAFGTVRSEVYTQYMPLNTSQIKDNKDGLDSAFVQFHVDFYHYGYGDDSDDEKYTIYPIIEDTITFSRRYYFNSSLGYDPAPVAEANFRFDHYDYRENLNLPASLRDTFLIKAEVDPEFAQFLFDYSVQNDSLGNPDFREKFKGFAIIPSSDNKTIIGINPNSPLSRYTLYYHNAANTRLERSFYFSPGGVQAISFNNISTTRSGDLASLSSSYQMYSPPSGMCYVQNGSPVITKLDLSEFYDFIRGTGDTDSLRKILINTAELSIAIEPPTADTPPPSTLILRVLKKVTEPNYLFMNSVLDEDSTNMSGFRLASDGRYYVASSDALDQFGRPQALLMNYNKITHKYVARPTLFLQNLFDRKDKDVDIAYLAIFPVSPDIGKSVNRVIFKQENIKLGIYYTKANLPNLD